jgi:hypothetical protein
MEQLCLVVMQLSTGKNETAGYEHDPYTPCHNGRHRIQH